MTKTKLNTIDQIDDKPNKQLANEITNYPQYCNSMRPGVECGKDTDVAIITVRDETGKTRTGAFSDFGYVKHQGEDKKLVLRHGYTFMHWNTRCALCYERDMHIAKKTAVPLPKSDPRYSPKNDEQKHECIEVMRNAIRLMGRRRI